MKKHHVCIVSGQLLPNLIPILMDHPEHVHMLATQGMQANAKRCEKILQNHQIPYTRYDDLPSTEFAAITAYAENLTLQLDDGIGGKHLVLNATGGTKLMALAFFEQFKQLKRGAEAEPDWKPTKSSRWRNRLYDPYSTFNARG
jgi:hypothetical protein